MTTLVPRATEQSSGDDDSANPLRELRLRLIAFESLSVPLQILSAVTVITVCIIGLLLATSSHLSPQIVTNITANGQLTQTPLAIYLVTVSGTFVGWWCIVVASTRIHSIGRLIVCLLVAVALGISPTLRMYAVVTRVVPANITDGATLLPALQLLLVVVLVAWIVIASLMSRKGPKNPAHSGRQYWTISSLSVLVGVYFTLDILIVSVYDPATPPQFFIPSSVAAQSTLLPGLLAIVVYWSSIDFIEWGEILAASIAKVVSKRFPLWVFVALVTLSASVFAADTIRRLSLIGLLPSLLTAGVLILVDLVIMRLARVNLAWPIDVPIGALLAGAIFLFVFVQVSLALVSLLSAALTLPGSSVNPLYTLMSVSLAILFLGIGLLLIVRGGNARNNAKKARFDIAASGLFFTLVALLVIALSIPQLENVLGLPVIPALQPNVADFKIITGVAIVSVTLILAIRRRWNVRLLKPYTAAFMLLVGLQVIGWYFQLFLPGLYTVSKRSEIVAALIFIAAVLWDLITSGDQMTNLDSPSFPRSARLLLYLGYALFAATTFLYTSSQHLVSTGQVVPLPTDGISLAVVGAEGLGLPLLAFTFAQRMRHRRDRQVQPSTKGRTSNE